VSESIDDPENYELLWKRLDQEYGYTTVQSQSKITKMLDIPELKSTDPKQVLTFARKLNNSVSELSKGEEASELLSQGNIRFMSLKLPTSLREKWSGKCYDARPRQLNLVDLDDWLTKLSKRKEYDQLLHGALEESLKSESHQNESKPEQKERGK